MHTSGSHAAMSWADVHTYGELLSGRGGLSTLGSFTHMFTLGRSSRSTLVEEALGQRMCNLFSQGECIEAGGGSGSVDPVECLVALGQTGTQDNEDADVFQSDNSDEDIDVLLTNEANDDFDDDGHKDPNIDDIVGDRDLYNGCPTWSDVTPEFAKGMVFKDKDAVIRASSIVENVNNHSGFTVSYKKAGLGRTKAIAMIFGDWDSSYKKLPRFMRTLELRNPGTAVILETLDLVKDLIWKAGTAHQVRKFNEAMDEIKKLGTNSESAARAYRALCNEDPRKWTLAYDGGYRWGVTTTNDSECYNNVLRGARDLPITSCVEVTFYRLVATFNDKRRQIESALAKGLRYTSKVQAKLEEYQARSAGHHGIWFCRGCYKCSRHDRKPQTCRVFESTSCDCGKWMIYHYPCSHMLAVCAKSGRQPWHLIDPKYRIDVYAHVYDTSFEQMVHEHYWAAYDGPKIIPHPSRRRDPTSGRPTKRIHNEMDVSRKRQNNHCGPMNTVGSPGPIDGTVLTLQSHHRSTWIWEHGGTDALACRRCGTGLYDRELDPRVLQYVLRAGFYGVRRLGPIRLDHALITPFVEHWRPETHTFHLHVGEASITLQDVAILLGLPIDGAPITHPQTFVTVQECQDICMQAFGIIPPAEAIDSGRLRMSWLHHTFDVLLEHVDDVSVQRHARAYILRLIGGILFTDYSQTLVRVAYLPFLLDLDATGACSWGSAVLAMLYRSMCRATKIGQRQIAGALLLLQIWACERFPRMCPYRVDDHTAGQQPLLIGGCISPVDHGELDGDLDFARPLFPLMLSEFTKISWTFTWRPYDDIMHELPDYCRIASDIWISRSPLVCFEVVEWHLPNRLYGEYIDHWHHRREYLVVGVIDDAAMRYDDSYMVWYRRITRTLVGNPAHRPTSGYVEIGSTIEIATRYIAAIHDRIDRAIYASLHALREHERIGQPGVPEPPPTIPPVVPAASLTMPPTFPVHPPPSMSSFQQFT
ncbi:hypothetical protein Acr_04g0001050 [Actinidia rufa]|uniref:SWIM-type domain-containing protein n=1 Tax=Actinidia rufa TaxID=165716 RepID=A0A7J0EI98_9ERIC|nr:hypothetical protein Acr_04g0001050 [Actinidia rufa]